MAARDNWLFVRFLGATRLEFLAAFLLGLAPLAAQQTPDSYSATTYAGTGFSYGDGGLATSAVLLQPHGVSLSKRGEIYIADYSAHCVRKVAINGAISTVAGICGQSGFSGDGGPAAKALFSSPSAVALDSAGNLYIAENWYSRIRKVAADGLVSTYAGTGGTGLTGDGGPAKSAQIGRPYGLVVDSSGVVYFSDTQNNVVRKIAPDGTISRVAGTGTAGFSGDTGPARGAQLKYPTFLALDGSGNLYVSDSSNFRVRRISSDGTITTIAGMGWGGNEDTEVRATHAAIIPYGLAFDATGNLYVGTSSQVRRIDTFGAISTVAGRVGRYGFAGDDGPASSASFRSVEGLAIDSRGLFIADSSNHRVRLLNIGSENMMMKTIVGSSRARGDGGPATSASLFDPGPLTVDSAGNLYIADFSNHRIRMVKRSGVITTFAGGENSGFGGDGGPATQAMLLTPRGLALDVEGNLWFADYDNERIRKISPEGIISTQAGDGYVAGFARDGPAKGTSLFRAYDVAVDSAGNVFIAESNRIRQIVAATGMIRAFAGDGTAGYSGDDGPAKEARLNTPHGLVFHQNGDLYFSDSLNQVIRKITPSGVISTVYGQVGKPGFSGDSGPASTARFNLPRYLAFDSAGNLVVADVGNSRLRRITPSGSISTIAGGGSAFNEGALATSVRLDGISGLTVDASGNIYVSSSSTHRVYRLARAASTTPAIPATPVPTVAPGKLSILGGDKQQGTVHSWLPQPLSVGVTDATGKTGMPGVTVTFMVAAGSAWLSSSSVKTDENGRAEVNVVLGENPGVIKVVASVQGLTPVTFELTAIQPVVAAPPKVVNYLINTFAGSDPSGDGGPAVSAILRAPHGLALDSSGNLFVADASRHVVCRVSPDGAITMVAGSGEADYGGDGGPAAGALLNEPAGVAMDKTGNLYILERSGNRVRRVSADGIISTVVGTGAAGNSGDGGPAIAAQLRLPQAIAVGAGDELFIADTGNYRIRKVDAGGTITTIAGTGASGFGGDGGPADGAAIGAVSSLAVDDNGNLYFADQSNNRVRRVDTQGVVSTVAGNGQVGAALDGGLATDGPLTAPASVALDKSGNLYVGSLDRLRRVSPSGTIGTLAGGGAIGNRGDGGPALEADIATPMSIVIGHSGDIYFSSGGFVRMIDNAAQTISTFAGADHFAGDGSTATSAVLDSPDGVLAAPDGSVYIADSANHRVRRVTLDGLISTVAGNGADDSYGDGGPAADAALRFPAGLAMDKSGNLFVSDTNSHLVRRIAMNRTITTVAGTGSAGFSGDDGPAQKAQLSSPKGLALDAAGNLYVADTGSNRIRRISTDGAITTVAGNGEQAFNGEERLAKASAFSASSIAVDSTGNLYLGDSVNHRIRKISPAGVMTTVAGTGLAGFSGDGGPAVDANLNAPQGIAVDAEGNLYVADGDSARIRKISPSGGIVTIAGTGTEGFSGDGGSATSARLTTRAQLWVDAAGNVYVADKTNNRIRILSPTGQ